MEPARVRGDGPACPSVDALPGPGRPLRVLYDECCGVCTRLARWLARHGDGVTVHPIGSPAGDLLLRDLAPADRYRELHAVDHLGRRYSGGDAAPSILRTLPGGAMPAALAAAVPGLTGALYRCVARRRRVLGRL